MVGGTAAEVIAAIPAAHALVAACTRARLSLANTWVVGGAVRDALLGRPGIDLDLVHGRDGVALARTLAKELEGELVATHSFGTATVRVDLAGRDVLLDVATARTERYEYPGALPSVELGASIRDDLRRRDFTVNALAASLDAGAADVELLGVCGVGQPADETPDADVMRGIVRVLHERSFEDDPTRVLRAVRYAGRLGFEIEPRTATLLESALAGGALATVSANRIGTELELLCREPAAASLQLLAQHRVLAALDPSLDTDLPARVALMERVDAEWSSDAAHAAVAWHMRLALLVAPLGSRAARPWLAAHGMSGRDVTAVVDHLRMLELIASAGEHIASATPPELLELLHTDDPLVLAFGSLAAPGPTSSALDRYVAAVENATLSITGHDLHAMGLERGPQIGHVLDELYRRKLGGELGDAQSERSAAENLVKRMEAEHG